MFIRLYEMAFGLIARMQREEGQTMAEYGLLLALIAVVVIVAAALLGTKISSVFNYVAGQL